LKKRLQRCVGPRLRRTGEPEGFRSPPSIAGAAACWLLAFCAVNGCAPQKPIARPIASAADPSVVPTLVDVTKSSGLAWRHEPCRSGRKYLPETYGGGGGFLDYDRDGDLDVLLINGAPLPGYKGPIPRHGLFRNDGGKFSAVKDLAGIRSPEYGMGAAVADFDNDGWSDVYLTSVGRNRLFRNEAGRFVDVTDRAGVGDPRWSVAAAWLDYDRDGRLDLFVANYVEWSPGGDLPCGGDGRKQYCPPYQYRGAPPTLYRNRGNGTFEDVSAAAGVRGHASKSLAATPCDVNGDGWVDLHIANDTEPSVLLVNQRNGTFSNSAISAGVSVGTDGTANGSMGVDTATPWNDGRLAFAVGNFVGQGLSLFATLGPPGPNVLFENLKQEAALRDSTLPMSTFGTVFSDMDRDGWTDLLILNGNLDESLMTGQRNEPYRQLPQLFQNRRDGKFAEVGKAAGFEEPLVGRGLAVGDYDNDGSQDFLAFENGGPVRLWRNATPTRGGWIGVELQGSAAGPRDGTGATVTVKGSGWSQSRLVSTARSYLAVNDPRVHFGLGARQVESLEVRWPGGAVDTILSPALGEYLRIVERRGAPGAGG
jgi:enediyne biosynthesis protein E4